MKNDNSKCGLPLKLNYGYTDLSFKLLFYFHLGDANVTNQHFGDLIGQVDTPDFNHFNTIRPDVVLRQV